MSHNGRLPCFFQFAKKKTQSMFRRPLTGESGQRLYTLPPLPPTSTTLAAFKSLLLDRLRLLRIAGKFHVNSVLGIPKELEQELNPEVAGASAPAGDSDGTAKANGNAFGSAVFTSCDCCGGRRGGTCVSWCRTYNQ